MASLADKSYQNMKRTLLPILLFFAALQCHAQSGVKPIEQANIESDVVLFDLSYGAQMSGADLNERFGNSLSVGGGGEYMLASNWSFGLKGSYFFGNIVKEDVLAGLRNAEGEIFGSNQEPSTLLLKYRGWYAGAHLGKLIPLNPKSKNRSGIKITVGAGLLQHKIRIQNDPQSIVLQVSDEYGKGYDRLTNGLALNQFIGYQSLGANRRINFSIGIELTEGFTANRRSNNVGATADINEPRLDLQYGLIAKWHVPIYQTDTEKEYYY